MLSVDDTLTGLELKALLMNSAEALAGFENYTVTGGALDLEKAYYVLLDSTPPVLTLTGDATVTLDCGATYVDAGATALDNLEGNITSAIVVNNPVNTSVADVYTITYDVSDIAGNVATQITREVTVVEDDLTAPVITLTGNASETVECGATYTDAGATAADACEGDLTSSISTNNPVDTSVPDVYTITYDVTDGSSNAATQVTRTVTVSDTVNPVVTLTGNAAVSVECGATYTDAGATALDACEGDLTSSISVNNPVNTLVPDIYTVTYDVTDGSSNAATQVTRTVTVTATDSTAPVISLLGSASVVVECGATYTDAGATAADACEGNLTSSIQTSNPVDTSVPDVYTVTYDVMDGSSNAATQVTRTVTVSDTTAPTISLVGNATVTVECGATYTDAGATATDTCEGDLTSSIQTSNPVDTSVPDVYTVTYDVTDGSSNAATQVTRTVTVSDTSAPTISLVGNATVTVECGATYTDAGATATDTCDGDLTSSIQTSNPVDTSVPDVYTITYDVADGSSNAATQVTRTVTVLDNCVVEGEGEGDGGGEGTVDGEGVTDGEGTVDGEGMPDGEASMDGEGAEGEGEGADLGVHSSDIDGNGVVDLPELLRVAQFYNAGEYHCDDQSEDGYAPFDGDRSCMPSTADYNPQDWNISLSEVLRMIQYFRVGGIVYCPGTTEDNYCPVAPDQQNIPGDVDADGRLTAEDLQQLYEYVNGTLFELNRPDLADVNQDTVVNEDDVLALLNLLGFNNVPPGLLQAVRTMTGS
ncbi:MAG: DUF5011 domain-containing protein [Candidatus Hydrogenedens sp.]|nr:DUF5011 domain-containing protein [Candidatus Hydrogenedens sp.]